VEAWELYEMKQKAAEVEKLQQELSCYKRKMGEYQRIRLEWEALSRENRQLRCTLADQEDQINQLVNTTDYLSESSDKRQV
jgi:predicted RNase H-like nuclease (RuvC/YqgF family)